MKLDRFEWPQRLGQSDQLVVYEADGAQGLRLKAGGSHLGRRLLQDPGGALLERLPELDGDRRGRDPLGPERAGGMPGPGPTRRSRT